MYYISKPMEEKMTLIKFEPLREFDRLTDQVESFFNNSTSAFNTSSALPKVDVFETTNALNVEVEIPGVKKEDIKLTLEDNILTIQGEKKVEKRNDIQKSFRCERSFGSFKRSFTLPVDVNPDKVNAKFENGLLSITLEKNETQSLSEKTIELK